MTTTGNAFSLVSHLWWTHLAALILRLMVNPSPGEEPRVGPWLSRMEAGRPTERPSS